MLIEDDADDVNRSGKSCTAVSVSGLRHTKVHAAIKPCSVYSFSAHWLTRI